MGITWSVVMATLNRKQKCKSLQLRRYFIFENLPTNDTVFVMATLYRKQKCKSLQLRRYFICENLPTNDTVMNSLICSVRVEIGKTLFLGHVTTYLALTG